MSNSQRQNLRRAVEQTEFPPQNNPVVQRLKDLSHSNEAERAYTAKMVQLAEKLMREHRHKCLKSKIK
jgi:hypothetical protein